MSDRGHAPVELALAAGLLLLPVALMVTAFGPWSETRVMAESLAAESARTAVLRLDHEAGASLVARAVQQSGLHPDDVRLGWCGQELVSPDDALRGCSFERGTYVEVRLELWTPLISTPWGDVGGVWVTADHTEPIDLYRSLP